MFFSDRDTNICPQVAAPGCRGGVRLFVLTASVVSARPAVFLCCMIYFVGTCQGLEPVSCIDDDFSRPK